MLSLQKVIKKTLFFCLYPFYSSVIKIILVLKLVWNVLTCFEINNKDTDFFSWIRLNKLIFCLRSYWWITLKFINKKVIVTIIIMTRIEIYSLFFLVNCCTLLYSMIFTSTSFKLDEQHFILIGYFIITKNLKYPVLKFLKFISIYYNTFE